MDEDYFIEDTGQIKNVILKELYGIKRLNQTWKYEFPNLMFFLRNVDEIILLSFLKGLVTIFLKLYFFSNFLSVFIFPCRLKPNLKFLLTYRYLHFVFLKIILFINCSAD